jgi:hypothetical protein
MIEIPLTQGKVVRIEDLPLISPYRWYAARSYGQWYAFSVNHPPIKMHQLILPPADGLTPDHIDGDGLNNTRANLRLATRLQQRMNTGKRQGAKHSAYKGVTLHQGRWCAEIKINGRRIRKMASSDVDAARIYNKLACKLFGAFARLNEVPADGE